MTASSATSPSPDRPDRYAVLGNPVAHSRSPFIHAEFARQTGEAVSYGRIECPLDGFQASVQAFIASADAAAGLGPARGCNITVPFKFQVLRLARQLSPRAALAQAANVLRFDADGWFADNTDGIGLVRDVQRGAGISLAGKRVLLIGAGGAASGVLGPLLDESPKTLVVANRTVARAAELVQRHATVADRRGVALMATGLDDCGEAFDIVLNSSSSSLSGAAVPVASTVLAPGALALDMMYGPAAAPFLAWAQEHGAVGRDGLGMLVEQAAEAFFVWRGVRPDAAAALAALRAHLAAGH